MGMGIIISNEAAGQDNGAWSVNPGSELPPLRGGFAGIPWP